MKLKQNGNYGFINFWDTFFVYVPSKFDIL